MLYFEEFYFLNLCKDDDKTEDNQWRAQDSCKRGGNKYGEPTQCCGDTFPEVMPLQKVCFTPSKFLTYAMG